MSEALRLLADGRTGEGIARLRHAVEVAPDRIEAWGHLAASLTIARRHQEAVECYEAILRRAPHVHEARWRMADRLVRLGRLDEAESRYRTVLDSHPACHDARCGLQYVAWLREKGRDSADGGNGPGESGETQSGESLAPLQGQKNDERIAENSRRAMLHFERGDRSLSALPPFIQVETTTRCNAACITCIRGHLANEPQDLQPAVFERIVRELMPTAATVNLSGTGEPLLAGGFDEFFAEAGRRCGRVELVTNASVLSMKRLDRFARRQTHVAASIDGATRETFESIRRKLRFDRVLERLHLYKKVRDIYPEVGSTLTVYFVALRRNIEELPAVVDLAAELGAGAVIAVDFATADVPPEIAAEHLSHCPELANRMFDRAAAHARELGIVLRHPPKYGEPAKINQPSKYSEAPEYSEPSKTGDPNPVASGSRQRETRARWRILPARNRFPRRCPDAWMKVYISATGVVHPCCVIRRVMGDLTQQSFAEIWNGRRYRSFRRRLDSFLPRLECRECTILTGVNGGNPSVVQAKEGCVVELLYRMEIWARRGAGIIRRAVRRG